MFALNYRIILLIIFATFQAKSQQIQILSTNALPNACGESSGLTVVNSNAFWTHNDSGNPSEIYRVDSLGKLTRRIYIKNASNIDWEEIRDGKDGYYYIGDFGNNNNDRQNLRILKINNPENHNLDSIDAEIITFHYPNQYAYPPADSDKNFDMEAMICKGDYLYLFSKNRSSPYTGFTYLYRLPKIAGNYTATLLDSMFCGTGSYLESSVTSAAWSPDQSKILLIGYQKYWLLQKFSGESFFKGSLTIINSSNITQKEGIDFLNESFFYMTDEKVFGTGGNLYKAQLILSNTGIKNIVDTKDWDVYPNPFTQQLHIKLGNTNVSGKVEVYNENGKRIWHDSFQDKRLLHITELENIPAGVYYVQIKSTKMSWMKKFEKVN